MLRLRNGMVTARSWLVGAREGRRLSLLARRRYDHEVANGYSGDREDVEMGILPSGTGGDFRRTINSPQTMREAARALSHRRKRRPSMLESHISEF